MSSNARLHGGLTTQDWWLLGLLLGAVVVLVFLLLPMVLDTILGTIDVVALVIGTGSLGIGAYAALSTYRLKEAEQVQGKEGARAVVTADVEELRRTCQSLEASLNDTTITRDEWSRMVRRLESVGAHLERRLDHLPFLSPHFSRSEFATLGEFYFRLRLLTFQASELHVPEGARDDDLPRLLSARRESLTERLSQFRQVLVSAEGTGLVERPGENKHYPGTDHCS